MSLRDLLTQDQRMLILHSLVENGNTANNEVLQDCLDIYGHRISQDLLLNHLNWLEEQGLVWVNAIGALKIARITARGADVQANRAKVDGVKKNPFIDGFR